MEKVQEELLHCSICMEIFSDPRGLPCQHTFCCDFLTTYIEGKRKSSSSKLSTFDCPLCQRNVSLKSPSSDGDSFPINLVITSLLNINKSGKHRIAQRHKENISSSEKICQTSNPSLCDKICQTSKEKRFVRNKFAQTKLIRSKEVPVQATKHVKKTNQGIQTITEFKKCDHIEPQVQRQHKATQTEKERIVSATKLGKGCSCNSRPSSVWIFQFVGDKWDMVFNRRFDNLIEKLIIRYIILNIATDVSGCGMKRQLKALLANVLCYICLIAYLVLMLCLFAGIAQYTYVFIIFLLYKRMRQALTIDINAYPGVSINNHYGHFKNILFLHVVWFWVIVLCLCFLLFIMCLLISVRGHPNQKTVCLSDEYTNLTKCRSVVLNYPDMSFLEKWSKNHFEYYLSRLIDLDLSELRNDLFRHVIKGEAIVVKEKHDVVYPNMGRYNEEM